jgi:hypothetical protein
MSSTSSSSSSTLQDDSTSATLGPCSPSPSPPFFYSSLSYSDSSASQCSSDSDEEQVVPDGESDMAFSGIKNVFGDRDLDDNDLARYSGLDDGSLSAQTLDRILLRAETRLREQEQLARELGLAPEPEKDTMRIKPRLAASLMDCSKPFARPNSKILISKELRKLADKPKVVNDPLLVRKAARKKSMSFHSSSCFDMMKSFSYIISTRIYVLFWVLLRFNEGFSIS